MCSMPCISVQEVIDRQPFDPMPTKTWRIIFDCRHLSRPFEGPFHDSPWFFLYYSNCLDVFGFQLQFVGKQPDWLHQNAHPLTVRLSGLLLPLPPQLSWRCQCPFQDFVISFLKIFLAQEFSSELLCMKRFGLDFSDDFVFLIVDG